MGFKQIRTSDVTGKILNDEDILTVVVKSHPDIQESKVFDSSADELGGLKAVSNLVSLEVRNARGDTSSLVVNKADFDKLVTAEKLKSFDNARGRRTGFRPTNGNGDH